MPGNEKSHGTALVTGGSGQLGRRLVPRLTAAGYRVKAHYRSAEKAQKYCPPGVEPVFGDLADPRWLGNAVRGCDVVIHAAARVSLRSGGYEQMRKVNVDGTRAVVAACLEGHVSRLIYVSTCATVGASPDGNPIDEDAVFNLGGLGVPYIDTKQEAETLALAANGERLRVMSVNPAIMISPPDRQIRPSDLKKIPRWLPAYFDFGLNLVETDDVVSAIVACIEKGRAGQRYLLTGDNLDASRVFALSGKYLGIRKPFLKIPVSFLYPIAIVTEIVYGIRRNRPRFHRGLARLARFKFVYTNRKARNELGFNPRSLEKTIERILEKIGKASR